MFTAIIAAFSMRFDVFFVSSFHYDYANETSSYSMTVDGLVCNTITCSSHVTTTLQTVNAAVELLVYAVVIIICTPLYVKMITVIVKQKTFSDTQHTLAVQCELRLAINGALLLILIIIYLIVVMIVIVAPTFGAGPFGILTFLVRDVICVLNPICTLIFSPHTRCAFIETLCRRPMQGNSIQLVRVSAVQQLQKAIVIT
jgi:hypothetical protein